MPPPLGDKDSDGSGDSRVDRFSMLVEGWSEDLAASLRIWYSRWEAFRDRWGSWFPAVGLLLLLVACAIGWLGQSAVHLLVGGSPPGPGAFQLVPIVGVPVLMFPSWTTARLLLAGGVLLVCSVYLLGPGIDRAHPLFRALHLEKEGPESLRRHPGRREQLFWLAILATLLTLLVLLFLFALAGARADAFFITRQIDGRLDRFLSAYYRLYGLSYRPNWWGPALAWCLQAPVLAGIIFVWGRLRGIPWTAASAPTLHHPTRRLWEWCGVGLVAIVYTSVALWNIADTPWIIQQDDGIGARFGMALTLPGSTVNFFGNDWLPYPTVTPRGVMTAWMGNRNEVLRVTSSLVGGLTILAAFFCFRALFPAATSLFLVLLTACSYHVHHFARVGTMHIDSLLVMFVLLGVLLRAELAAPGPRRIALYSSLGALAALSLALYPASQLGLAAIGITIVLRCFCQPGFMRNRLWGFGALAATALLMTIPFKAIPGPAADRSHEIYLLHRAHLFHEFERLDREGIPARTVDDVLKHHFRNALGVFHYSRDKSHNLSTPFPAASPLAASLALLGAGVMLLRFRSTVALLCLGTFLVATFFGGALRFGPHPPSSSRMIVLVPILMIAAGIPVVMMEQATREFFRRRSRLGDTRATTMATALVALILVWTAVQELRTNHALYRRCLQDFTLMHNSWMAHSTEIQRFVQTRVPSPDVIYHFGIDETANQTYLHNDFLLPHTMGRRFWVGRGAGFDPQASVIHPGRTWFIFDRRRIGEMSPVMDAFPGGLIIETQPPDLPEAISNFTVYEVMIQDRPGPVSPAWPWY